MLVCGQTTTSGTKTAELSQSRGQVIARKFKGLVIALSVFLIIIIPFIALSKERGGDITEIGQVPGSSLTPVL